MLEELKQILEIVKELPHLVMWVLAGLLLYKVTVIGSVFGIIKLSITKFHDYLVKEKVVRHEYKFDGICIDEAATVAMTAFLKSVAYETRGEVYRYSHAPYIHKSDVEKITNAWEKAKVPATKATP